jgi:PAS domain S-box-containing protein
MDARGIVTDWNTRAEEAFGWTAAEALGKDLNRLIVPPESRAAHSAGLRRYIDTGVSTVLNRVLEMEAMHKRGTRVPVEMAIASFHDGRNHVITAFVRDITHRREAEKREAARAKSLEEARAALQHAQKLEAVGKLTGGVAHDFNNVLQIMGGNLQLLQMRCQGDTMAEKRISSMLDAVDRGAKLSSHLLAFARRQPLKPQIVNLDRLLNDARDLLRQAVGGSVTIDISVAENLWNTLVDPHQLENVILNLALNARDAMEGAGTLRIELANTMLDDAYAASHPGLSPGPYVLIKVSDTGSGMSPEVMEHVFEPFFTTKPPGQGTGLGLSMAYGFVKQSGGHIQLESKKGEGSTFRIYLPRSAEAEVPAPLPVSDETVGGNETILVVEDDIEVGETVVAILGELGYQVLKAGNAQGALDILKSGAHVDLLFTDVVMPGPLRGPELAREAKLIALEIVVLFTSGYTQNAIERSGRLDPDIHLLSKPYRREQLAQTLRRLLASKKREVLE